MPKQKTLTHLLTRTGKVLTRCRLKAEDVQLAKILGPRPTCTVCWQSLISDIAKMREGILKPQPLVKNMPKTKTPKAPTTLPITMTMWCIYYHPKDFPDSVVARRWELNTYKNETAVRPTENILIGNSIDEVRGLLAKIEVWKRGKYCADHPTVIPRTETDDPTIVEVWI